jgi:hypothetical protein
MCVAKGSLIPQMSQQEFNRAEKLFGKEKKEA